LLLLHAAAVKVGRVLHSCVHERAFHQNGAWSQADINGTVRWWQTGPVTQPETCKRSS